jgi:hypothetical protein
MDNNQIIKGMFITMPGGQRGTGRLKLRGEIVWTSGF